MAVRYIQGFPGAVTTTTAGWGHTLPFAFPIGYDKTIDTVVFEDEAGTIRRTQAPQAPKVQAAATLTLTTADRDRVFLDTLGSGPTAFTLPTAASMPGASATFINGDAAGEILITPNAADQISAKGLVDHSTSVKPAAGTGIKNTAATNVLGDHITLVSDGVNTWHEVSGAGIWASQ